MQNLFIIHSYNADNLREDLKQIIKDFLPTQLEYYAQLIKAQKVFSKIR